MEKSLGHTIIRIIKLYFLRQIIDVAHQEISGMRKLQNCLMLTVTAEVETRITTVFRLQPFKSEGKAYEYFIATAAHDLTTFCCIGCTNEEKEEKKEREEFLDAHNVERTCRRERRLSYNRNILYFRTSSEST